MLSGLIEAMKRYIDEKKKAWKGGTKSPHEITLL